MLHPASDGTFRSVDDLDAWTGERKLYSESLHRLLCVVVNEAVKGLLWLLGSVWVEGGGG